MLYQGALTQIMHCQRMLPNDQYETHDHVETLSQVTTYKTALTIQGFGWPPLDDFTHPIHIHTFHLGALTHIMHCQLFNPITKMNYMTL